MPAPASVTRPTFQQLKKTFLDSGFEIRHLPRTTLEQYALDAPYEAKRHYQSNIYGLIMPDEYVIGIAQDRTPAEKLTTLIHELIHLYNDELPEDEVEDYTLELEQSLTPAQLGFFQFLVS